MSNSTVFIILCCVVIVVAVICAVIELVQAIRIKQRCKLLEDMERSVINARLEIDRRIAARAREFQSTHLILEGGSN